MAGSLPFSFFQQLNASGDSLVTPFDGATNSWLSIRSLKDSGEFSQTISCFAAAITILPSEGRGENGKKSIRPFRDLILAKDSLVNIELRFGNRRIHPAEIFVVGLRDNQWRQTTLLGAAVSAGVPRSFVPEMLKQIELEGYANRSPVTLHVNELRRFALVCSFFSKAQFLLFDQPFQGEGSAMVENLAELMAEAALVTKKVFLISRLSACPKAWHDNPCVISYDEAHEVAQKSVFQMRSLRAQSEPAVESEYFVTRPHTISRPPARVVMNEAVAFEKITNPHLEGNDDYVESQRALPTPLNSYLPAARGQLTAVSLRVRLSSIFGGNPFLDDFRAVAVAIKEKLRQVPQLPCGIRNSSSAKVSSGYLASVFIAAAALVLLIGIAVL